MSLEKNKAGRQGLSTVYFGELLETPKITSNSLNQYKLSKTNFPQLTSTSNKLEQVAVSFPLEIR